MFWSLGATPESIHFFLQSCRPLVVDTWLVVAMLRRELLCDVIVVVVLIINLKLDRKQESMVAQVCQALSKQVRE